MRAEQTVLGMGRPFSRGDPDIESEQIREDERIEHPLHFGRVVSIARTTGSGAMNEKCRCGIW